MVCKEVSEFGGGGGHCHLRQRPSRFGRKVRFGESGSEDLKQPITDLVELQRVEKRFDCLPVRRSQHRVLKIKRNLEVPHQQVQFQVSFHIGDRRA